MCRNTTSPRFCSLRRRRRRCLFASSEATVLCRSSPKMILDTCPLLPNALGDGSRAVKGDKSALIGCLCADSPGQTASIPQPSVRAGRRSAVALVRSENTTCRSSPTPVYLGNATSLAAAPEAVSEQRVRPDGPQEYTVAALRHCTATTHVPNSNFGIFPAAA